MGSIPGWKRSSGRGNGNPLQYSCPENPMDRGTWWALVHRVTKSQIWLRDLVLSRMLRALVLCSLSEHVFCCALLTLPCACVNEWQALREASKGPCSAVPQWSHTAYGRNLLGCYTDLSMPRGTQCLLREPTRNGQSVWTELSFLGQTFRSLWPFHNSLRIRSTNLIYRIIDFQEICDLYCYCILWLRSQTWIGIQDSA